MILKKVIFLEIWIFMSLKAFATSDLKKKSNFSQNVYILEQKIYFQKLNSKRIFSRNIEIWRVIGKMSILNSDLIKTFFFSM